MSTITHNFAAIYGSVVTKVESDGVSAYGNERYKITFEGDKVFRTSPGANFELPMQLYVGEPVEFTLDPVRRVNELHVVSVFVAKTSSGDRWVVADDLSTAKAIQASSFPNDKIDSLRWASTPAPTHRELGKRQIAILIELSGGKSVLYLKPSERKTVYRSLLRLGLISTVGNVSITPRGRYVLLAQP
jgi:hypothetical protein